MQALCTALGFVGYSCSSDNVALYQRFVDHMGKYGLSYGTSDELQFRFELFAKTDSFIQESNSNPELTYVSGHNEFSTWTDAEFNKMLGKLSSSEDLDLPSIVFDETDLPDSKDWRSENKVQPVQNQGTCGGCWAFSVTAALESSYAIRKNLKISDAYKLSEQQFIDCVKDITVDGTNPPQTCCGGCGGGLEQPGFDYAKSNAIAELDDYKFVEKDETCKTTGFTGRVKVDTHAHLTPGNAGQVKEAVNTYGPTCVSIHAGPILKQYESGILNNENCLSTPVNHAVTAVGFGKDTNNQEYLIVRNSWKASWGEDGYFRISTKTTTSRPTGICAILSDSRYVKAAI